MKSLDNYKLVEKVIVKNGILEMLEDFYSNFIPGNDICEEDFKGFCMRYIDDPSEIEYIDENWDNIISIIEND